jgi:hypothetical protein
MQVKYGLAVLLLSMNMIAAEKADNPLAGVITMLHDLKAKIIKDGEATDAAFNEFYQWCDTTTTEEQHTIKTDKERIAKLNAEIEKETADIEAAGDKFEAETKEIADNEHDTAAATKIREQQHSDFLVAEKELVEAIDAMGRAITIIEREMQKSGAAALAQFDKRNFADIVSALKAVTDAASFSADDRSKLMAFVQSQHTSDEDEFASPSAAAYKSQSGSIVEVLEDMKEKAEAQLSEIRSSEVQSKNEYKELMVSLKMAKEAAEKDLAGAKDDKAESSADKASATGSLKKTTDMLEADIKEYDTTKATCMQTASDHQNAVNSRAEELKVVAEATEILESMTGGAVSQTYSLLQESMQLSTTADLAHFEVVTLVKHMAKMHHSTALSQLASRIAAVIKYGSNNGDDPFGKVKNLIMDLIVKLQKEAEKDASNKVYCDEQLAETSQKESDLEDQLKKLTTSIDKTSANSAELKEDVKTLQAELAALAKEQAEMDKVRADEKAAFKKAKEDLNLGIEGVRKALSLLKDYYGSGDAASASAFVQDMAPNPPDVSHKKSGGAAAGIIEILEMTESDFATNLAKEETEETDSQNEYDEQTKENEIIRTEKENEIKHKTQEFKGLDKTIVQLTSDKDSAMSEMTAVLEYSAKVKDKCLAKPETYEERKKRRDSEIAGLKEALEILKNEAALMQRKRRGLRGGHLSA